MAASDWFDPANAQSLLDVQRWAAGMPPLAVPNWLLVASAVATVVFELGFVVLVFSRWRPWAVAMAMVFHLSTFVLMGILFWALILCFVAFFDWSAVGRRRSSAPVPPACDEGPSRHCAACAGLVGLVVLGGATFGVSSWPFATYPTFADRYTSQTATVEVFARTTEGQEVTVELFPDVPPSRRAAMIWNALARPHTFPLILERTVLPAGTADLAVYRVTIDTRTQAVTGRSLIREFPIG